MKYSVDGGAVWNDITESPMNISGINTTDGVKVKRLGDGGTTLDSDAQVITVTKATVPNTAGKTDCTTSSNNDGTLTGVTTDMEWKRNDGTWTTGDGNTITGLSSGTYYVRVKATGTVLASDNQELIIAAYVSPAPSGYSRPSHNYYTIKASAGEGGSISSEGRASYREGQDKSFAVTPDEGCIIFDVLVDGVSDGTGFRPEDGIKLSEVAKMAAVVWNTYFGSPYNFDQTEGTHWYDTYVNFAVKYGVLKAGDFADYERNATRAEMACIFAHALPESELAAISTIIPPDVAETDKYAAEIRILYAAGVLCGNDKAGTFTGERAITRAEAAAIITRIARPSVRIAE